MPTLRIYLCRHGQTDWNAEKRIQGWTDIPLNKDGRFQAKELADELSGISFQGVYCSDLKRSYETAEIIAGRTVEKLKLLRERSMGKFEGRYYDGRDSEQLAEFERRRNDWQDTLDGGESTQDHFLRIQEAIQMIRERHSSGGQVLIVGHGGTNSLILQVLLEQRFPKPYQITHENLQLYLIELTPGFPPHLWRYIPPGSVPQSRGQI